MREHAVCDTRPTPASAGKGNVEVVIDEQYSPTAAAR